MSWSVAAGLLMRSGEVRFPVSGFRWYVPSGGLVWNLGVNDTAVLLVVGMVMSVGQHQTITPQRHDSFNPSVINNTNITFSE